MNENKKAKEKLDKWFFDLEDERTPEQVLSKKGSTSVEGSVSLSKRKICPICNKPMLYTKGDNQTVPQWFHSYEMISFLRNPKQCDNVIKEAV